MICNVRSMRREDADIMYHAFLRQGTKKSLNLLLSYYSEQHRGERKVFIAEYEGEILGYITLLRSSKVGPYKDKFIPQIDDLNVFNAYRNQGIGTFLLTMAEKISVRYCDNVCIALSFLQDNLLSHSFFSCNDYKLDGTGLWNNNDNINSISKIDLDENIKIYMTKTLNKILD